MCIKSLNQIRIVNYTIYKGRENDRGAKQAMRWKLPTLPVNNKMSTLSLLQNLETKIILSHTCAEVINNTD